MGICFNYRSVVTWLVPYVVRVQDGMIRAGNNPWGGWNNVDISEQTQ